MTRQRAKSSTARPKTRAVAKTPVATGDGLVKIGEAARLVGVEPYVLRFWETQFPFLRPRHARSRHRHYDKDTLEALKIVKRLLHSEGFTIAGAKKYIRETGIENLRTGSKPPPAASPDPIHNEKPAGNGTPPALKRELTAILDDLRSLHAILNR